MGNYSQLLLDINAAIYENNQQEIDALEVRAVLREMVSELGAGYLFKGVATPSSPGTTQAPDENVFYVATTAGTYTYLGGLQVTAGEVAFLCYDGSWTKKVTGALSGGSIADNLTTNDATKVLSAKQGKVLKDGLDSTNGELTELEQEVDDLDEQINGIQAVNLTGAIPMVANTINQYVNGAKCDIDIPAGVYAFTIDTNYIGNAAYIYLRINGANVYVDTVENLNGRNISVPQDATGISVYANASNSPLTGDCVFLLHQDGVSGITDEIADLNESAEKIDGASKDTSVSFELKTTIQTQSDTKKDVIIKSGKYWVDVSPLSLLSASSVYVYAYYSDSPSTGVYIGDLSALMADYWSTNLQEIEFSKDVVALSLYHGANATGAGMLTISFVDEDATPSMDARFANFAAKSCPTFNAFSGDDTLAAGEHLELSQINVVKNCSISAEINGTIEDIAIGVGYDGTKATHRGYNAYWIIIKPTSIELWWNDNNDHLISTFNHGLTLDDHTKVSIIRKGTSAALRIVTKLGAIYENTEFDWKGVGAPFMENNNTSASVDVSLEFLPRDLTKQIWIFGDSYCGIFNDARWPWQLRNYGIDNYLVDARGGEAMKGAFTDLVSLLTLGAIPTYIVWALGMNGTGDQAGQTDASYVADYQKLWLMRFLRVCKQNNITPILCTIPSVPTLNHHALSAYVRSLGYRYIDFADAVGSQVDGTWYPGLLSDDNAHPTTEGARVLAMRVLRDFPQIAIMEK